MNINFHIIILMLLLLRQPQNNTEENGKGIDSPIEQDAPLDDLKKQQLATQ